jgi:hypothetical protein
MALPLLLALAATAAHPASLVGRYEGNQMEMAVGLELTADGRFQYGLSYGALDEEATGTWMTEGDHVTLTSDPVIPPRITLIDEKPAPPGQLSIDLDAPKGVTHQLFQSVVKSASGDVDGDQLRDDGPLVAPIDPKDPPVAIQLILPMYELAGPAVVVNAAKGYALRFRFEPNDIGKADFRATRLTIDQGDLLLDRHGRAIRFRRAGAP